jgi:cation diffusion facilitator family transporter
MSFKSDIRLQRNVLLVGFALMFMKALAYYLTRSNAILTDALESLVNIAAGSFALYSLIYASQPSDKDHPYGHGKIEFVAGLIEGTLIGIAGLAMIVKSGYNFWFPEQLHQLEIGTSLAFLAGAINFIMGKILERQGNIRKSMVMKSEGAHLQSDGYTSFAMVTGLSMVWLFDLYWLDNVIASLMAIYICYVSYGIIRKSVDGLMDKNDKKRNVHVFGVINAHRKPQWIDFHEFRIIQYGRNLHIDCHLVLPFYYTIKQEQVEVQEIERLISKDLDQQAEIFIHTDPCTNDFCGKCKVEACAYRSRAYENHSV